MEIVLKAPGRKLISKSRWEKDEKMGEFFFSLLRGDKKKGGGHGGKRFFISFSLLGGKSMLAAMIAPW